MTDDGGIPDYLKIPQDERKAAWEKARASRALSPPAERKYLPINEPPPEPKS